MTAPRKLPSREEIDRLQNPKMLDTAEDLDLRDDALDAYLDMLPVIEAAVRLEESREAYMCASIMETGKMADAMEYASSAYRSSLAAFRARWSLPEGEK